MWTISAGILEDRYSWIWIRPQYIAYTWVIKCATLKETKSGAECRSSQLQYVKMWIIMFSSAMQILKEKMCGEYEDEIIWQDIWLHERMGQVDLLKGSGDPVWCNLQICFTILDLNSRCPTRVSLWSWRRTISWDRRRLDWVLGYSYNYNSFLTSFIYHDRQRLG